MKRMLRRAAVKRPGERAAILILARSDAADRSQEGVSIAITRTAGRTGGGLKTGRARRYVDAAGGTGEAEAMRDGGTARPRVLTAALLVAICCAAAFSAAAADRVALVVGNGAYAHAPKLANPVNDAAAVGAALKRLGFSVMRVENASGDALRRRLRDFGRASRGAEVAVAFYAGHGVEVGGRNYLVPVDATLANDGDVAFEAVGLDLVMQSVEGASRFGLVILDACRDNPFVSRMERAGTTRAVGRGLARVEPTGVTLVAYAATAGRTAADGSGRHSPYTAALLEHIAEPGLDVGQMFRRVRESVESSTGGAQKPVYYGSLPSTGAYLSSPPPGGGVPAAVPGGQSPEALVAADRVFWESISGSADAADFEAYLEAFPSGVYAALARNRLERLGGGGSASSWFDAFWRELLGGGGVVSSPGPVPVPGPSGPDHEVLERGLGLDRADRVALQSGLNALGFDAGPVDGVVGKRTRRAISSWQSAKDYEATSYLTGEQAETLITFGRVAAAREREAAAREREREGRAARARDDAAFAAARQQNTVSAYEGYLRAHPSGAHVSEARRLRAAAVRARDDAAFAAARQQNTVSAYGGYLAAWPSGAHVSEARRLRAAAVRERDRRAARARDDAAFAAARRSGTFPAYEGYLRAHPSGAHVSEALRFAMQPLKEFMLEVDSALLQLAPLQEQLNEMLRSLEGMSWEEERLTLAIMRVELREAMEKMEREMMDYKQVQRQMDSRLERAQRLLEGLPNSAARRSAYRELSAAQSTWDRVLEFTEWVQRFLNYIYQ